MDVWLHKQQAICSKREWKSTANTCQPQTGESARTRSSEMSAQKIIVIEKADHKGDTKTIYSGVKALSGTDERDQTLFGQTRHNEIDHF